jgi:hypothetical protein
MDLWSNRQMRGFNDDIVGWFSLGLLSGTHLCAFSEIYRKSKIKLFL